jgi:hypothetical protein
MTKKDFIEEIRKCNKGFRMVNNRKCSSIFINNVCFFYDSVKLCFDDNAHSLFIFDRNSGKIMASIFYQMLQIGL